MPVHLWKPTVSGHFAFLFDTSESIRLVVFAEPTVWLYNRLMPNQSIASMPPIAGQRRYPLKVLYTVDVALQGKTRLSRRCAKSAQKCAEPQKMENPTRNLSILRGILVRSRELESLAL